MKKFFLALLLAASAACMAAQVAFADDSGFIAGGGSAGSGSGVGRDDIATSETASGVGRDDVLAFGSDMKDSVDKYGGGEHDDDLAVGRVGVKHGGGLGEGIDYAKEMWDKTINGINRYGLFFADSLGEVLWHDPVFLFYLTITIVGLVALGVIRALTS